MILQTDNKQKTFAIRLAAGGLLLVAIGLAYLFLTPKSYRAVTRIKVTDWVHGRDANNPSNLGVAPAECQSLRSDAVMDQVITNLGLNIVWSRRYHQGAVLATNETRALLKLKALIRPDPKSSLIEIQVTSEVPEETASIANELARVYQNYRQAQRQELIRDKLGSLKQQWDDANHKLQDARAAQTKLYFEINNGRSTNDVRLYDADAYALLLNKRIELEGEYTSRQNELAGLKKMDQQQLIQVLSSLDANSLLTPTLLQLNKARSDLMNAKLDHGPESPEVKNGTLVMDKINKRVDELVTADMAMKETDLAGFKETLDDLNQKIKHATTNISQIGIQDQRYIKISEEAKNLEQERNELQHKMDAPESVDAIRPASITTEIIDTAEIPTKPFSPDNAVALMIMSVGGCAVIAALLLLALSQRPNAARAKLRVP